MSGARGLSAARPVEMESNIVIGSAMIPPPQMGATIALGNIQSHGLVKEILVS